MIDEGMVLVPQQVWDEHGAMLELLAYARRLLITSGTHDPSDWVDAADSILAEYE